MRLAIEESLKAVAIANDYNDGDSSAPTTTRYAFYFDYIHLLKIWTFFQVFGTFDKILYLLNWHEIQKIYEIYVILI